MKTLNIVQMAKEQPELTHEVEFKDGMFLTVAFLPRPKLQKIFKEAQSMRMDYKTGIRGNELNNDKFAERFCDLCVKGWRGFTPTKVSRLISIDLGAFTPEEQNAEIPFSKEQIAYLVKNAYDLDQFLQNYCQDITNFAPNKDTEEKNFEASQSGS